MFTVTCTLRSGSFYRSPPVGRLGGAAHHAFPLLEQSDDVSITENGIVIADKAAVAELCDKLGYGSRPPVSGVRGFFAAR